MTGPGDRSGSDAEIGARAPSGGFRKGAFGVSGSGDTSGFGGLVRVEPGGAVALHSTERPYGGDFRGGTHAPLQGGGGGPPAPPGPRGAPGPRGGPPFFGRRRPRSPRPPPLGRR